MSENYELENHSVSITELSTSDLAEKNNWIGTSKVGEFDCDIFMHMLLYTSMLKGCI
jgi:hypothetical protein